MKTILTLTTALCLVAGAAQAGGSHEQPHGQPAQPATFSPSATNNVGARSGAAAASRSQATSTSGANSAAGATGGRSSANTGPVTVNNTTGGGSGGGYSARTPDVILGSVSGGNPCGLGAGAGGSGPGAGGLLSFMWEGGGCQRLEDAKLLHNMGYDAAAKERLCQDTTFSNAFARAGQPCAADVARWQAAGYRQRADGYWVR
jgi:hypothetical protein